jgi:hypothetical protein
MQTRIGENNFKNQADKLTAEECQRSSEFSAREGHRWNAKDFGNVCHELGYRISWFQEVAASHDRKEACIEIRMKKQARLHRVE